MSQTQTGDEHGHGSEHEHEHGGHNEDHGDGHGGEHEHEHGEKILVHGKHDIRSDHGGVVSYMDTHMGKEQVDEMVERLERGHHSASFHVKHEGIDKDYKLVKSGDHFRVHGD